MSDQIYERLAKDAGFDTFRQWVEYERTRRRIEENEYRVNAMRLMFGDAESLKLKRELEASNG